MGVRMNKWVISITVILFLGLVIGVTSYKVIKIHNDKVLLVESKYIIETAKKCLNEKVCNGDIITLKTLYDYGYLETQVNEVTKEYYNEESYVLVKDSEYQFIIVT